MTIEEALIASTADGTVVTGNVTVLIRRLREREDQIADMLRILAMQYGLEPAIVAQSLMEVGLGTPPSDEAAVEIHNQYHLTIQRLRREQGLEP